MLMGLSGKPHFGRIDEEIDGILAPVTDPRLRST
jgi:hypothetical protein